MAEHTPRRGPTVPERTTAEELEGALYTWQNAIHLEAGGLDQAHADLWEIVMTGDDSIAERLKADLARAEDKAERYRAALEAIAGRTGDWPGHEPRTVAYELAQVARAAIKQATGP